MARPLRVEVPGGLYHVIVRGNERKSVFRDDADRVRYLKRLALYRERFDFHLLAYCLMDNHVHLALETGKVALSRIMAGLQSSYTQYFNRRHDRAGHLFQGRYKAYLVERDRYALALLRYIHENPCKAGVVARPQDFRWSSDMDYRRGRGPEWLDVDRMLAMFGRDRSAATRGYRRLMRDIVEEPYEEAPNWRQAVKGDEAFADRVLQAVGEPPIVPRGVTVDKVAIFVGRKEGLGVDEMRGSGRRAARGRLIVAWLGREYGKIPIARSARYFDRDTSTFAKGVRRLEESMRTNAPLRRRLDALKRAARDGDI